MAVPIFEIRLSGVVPVPLLLDVDVIRYVEEPGQTVLRAEVLDQSALHDLLVRLSELGAEVIEIHRVTDD